MSMLKYLIGAKALQASCSRGSARSMRQTPASRIPELVNRHVNDLGLGIFHGSSLTLYLFLILFSLIFRSI
jgi:hypothetical protein